MSTVITTNNNNIDAGSGQLNCGKIISSSVPPAGSIIAFLGNAEPEGWLFMDGVTRTNNSDGKYNTLATLGIGLGGSGTSNYTPPNYSAAFLRGIGNNNGYSGPELNKPQTDDTKPHNHTAIVDATSSSHSHTVDSHSHNFPNIGTRGTDFVYDGQNVSKDKDTFYVYRAGQNVGSSGSGPNTNSATVNLSPTITINNNSGSETRPYNYGVRWILKW